MCGKLKRAGDRMKDAYTITPNIADNDLADREREQRVLAQTLLATAVAITSSLDLDQVLERVLAATDDVVPHDGANIALLDGESNRLTVVQHCRCYARNGRQPPPAGQPSVLVHFPHLMVALNEGTVVVVKDTAVLPTWQSLAHAPDIHSFLAAPIVINGRLVGILNLESRQPGFYDDRYRERVAALTRPAATAIHNAQRFARQRKLTRQIVTIQEEERRRLAYELHDDAGQALTALKIGLELLSDSLAGAEPKLQAQVQEIKAVAVETAVRIRQLAHGLRPPALDAIGLNRTLDGLCRDQASLTGLTIRYHGAHIPGIPEPIKINLYRVCQEALTNVVRHAAATEVQVTLYTDDQHIGLTVIDNGQGFNVQQADLLLDRQPGLGLTAARERIEQLDGQLTIQSTPGAGVRLDAIIPWRR